MSASGDHAFRLDSGTGPEYALSGKIMFSAIVVLFAAVVFMAGLHLYARCYVARIRRRQLERRRALRRVSRSQIVTYIVSRLPADRGLDGAVLSSLPVFMYAPPEGDQAPPPECAVCISEFEEKEVGRVLPTCGHSFHIECIDMWFRSHSTCPLCRSPVEQVVRRPSRPPGGVADEAGTGPSSGSADLCGPGKVKIDVPVNELVQESPARTVRLRPAETGEVDLESGPSESNRVRTPML